MPVFSSKGQVQGYGYDCTARNKLDGRIMSALGPIVELVTTALAASTMSLKSRYVHV